MRGYDISNMTLVEGESGVVVIDPLVSKETATAAFALYSKHRGPREGQFGTPTTAASADLLRALTVPQIFDSIAVRVDGPRAWDHHITIAWVFTDEDTTYVTELRNGALNHRPIAAAPTGTTTFRLTRADLVGILTGGQDLHAALADGAVHVEGDPADLGLLVSLLAPVDPNFAIVTP